MKTNKTQLLVISGIAVLLVALYLFADTNKPKGSEKKGPMTGQTQEAADRPSFDFAAYMLKVKTNTSNKDTLDLLAQWEQQNNPENLQKLINFYHSKGESVAEAHYTLTLAKKNKTEKLYLRAGDLYSATASLSNDDAMKGYLAENAVNAFKAAFDIDSTNTDTRIKLASAYMEQGTAPMQGVSILLDIVRKDSTNADAQFMLGKFGMVSGQFDKAIARLEKVIYLRPRSTDALFLLAMAYQNQGNKNKALELLEKCVKIEQNPELKKEIEGYIQNLKTGKQ